MEEFLKKRGQIEIRQKLIELSPEVFYQIEKCLIQTAKENDLIYTGLSDNKCKDLYEYNQYLQNSEGPKISYRSHSATPFEEIKLESCCIDKNQQLVLVFKDHGKLKIEHKELIKLAKSLKKIFSACFLLDTTVEITYSFTI